MSSASTSVTAQYQLNPAQNTGIVAAVRGSIVDLIFEQHIPAIHNVIYAQNKSVVLEVVAVLRSALLSPSKLY